MPIIALTADALEGDRQRCLAVGMDDFIAKPLRSDVLEAALKRWIVEPGALGPVDIAVLTGSDVSAREPRTPGRRPADPLPSTSGAIDPAAIDRLRVLQADIVDELVTVFLEQAPRQVQALRAAAASGNVEVVRRTAHTMKGDAAAWGAYELERRCLAIEQLLPAELPDSFETSLAALARELERVSAALRKLSGMERHLV
jgi:HPt (histidine-containing phosphotransfer) domain-containing protein